MMMFVVFIVLLVIIILFVWDYWRYDIVALAALFFLTVLGIIGVDQAFAGFSEPAVITVIAVLVISQGLINSGLVDEISNRLSRGGEKVWPQLLILLATTTVLSSFMSNIGALALLMPVAIRMAQKSGKSPAVFLMVLAFGSQFGGWNTLIGTPTNLIISSFRVRSGGDPFNIFEFTPVGFGVSLTCIFVIVLGGWKLVPQREIPNAAGALSQIEKYLTEVRVTGDSKLAGKRIFEINQLSSADVNVVTLIRAGKQYPAPSHIRIIQEDDILIVEGNHDDLKLLVDDTKVEFSKERVFEEGFLKSDQVSVVEVVVGQHSLLNRRTVASLDLYNRYGINLLALAHQEGQQVTQLKNQRLRTGDILILQGKRRNIDEALVELGCLPLAERQIRLGRPRQIFLVLVIFIGAIVISAVNLLPVHVSFSIAALVMVLTGVVSPHDVYKNINWPVIVLLGAMIPIGVALETTGGSEYLASLILESGMVNTPLIALLLVTVLSILLANFINNVAAVIVMVPIAINIALSFGVSIDPFLVAILLGGSASFLTPIGDQTNLLVMVPGGYKFGDYWRLGIVLEIIIVVVGIPLVLVFFPF